MRRPRTSSVPRVNVDAVLRRRTKLRECLVFNAAHSTLTPEFAAELSRLAAKHLPGANPYVIQPSLTPLLGLELTRPMLDQLAWRLAGNLRQLRSGQSVYPWRGQTLREWVPVQVLKCEEFRTARRDRRVRVFLKVLAGSSCGLNATLVWSRRFCFYVASATLGYDHPNSRSGCQFGHVAELVSMRFLGLADPDKSTKDGPGFSRFDITPGLKTWNRKLIKGRNRITAACPAGYQHACTVCHVGYDQCRWAVHPLTYTFKGCAACEQDPVPFESGAKVCVSCSRKLNHGG